MTRLHDIDGLSSDYERWNIENF